MHKGQATEKLILAVILVILGFLSGIWVSNLFILPEVATASSYGPLVNDYVQKSHAYERYGNSSVCEKTQGMSMAPAIFPGNTICYAPYDDEIGAIEGEVIIFRNKEDSKICHVVLSRVVEEGTLAYMTKGFNNVISDPDTVPEDRVIGVVTEARFT